jgi:hypothetical protein
MSSYGWATLLTTDRLIIFLAGMAVNTAFQLWRGKHTGRNIDWQPVGMIAAVAVLVFVVVQQAGLSYQVKACQKEFNETLQERARITDQADDLFGEQLNVTVDSLSPFLKMPPEISSLPAGDPVRTEWATKVITDWRTHIADVQRQRQELINARKDHQYPEPTCGK